MLVARCGLSLGIQRNGLVIEDEYLTLGKGMCDAVVVRVGAVKGERVCGKLKSKTR